jgi:hypothetical protein
MVIKMKLFKKIQENKFVEVVILCLVFSVFLIIGYKSLDPDFGWHLTTGRLILEKGIPKTDPFSYTMPSFPFVDHEWLTNTLLAKAYPSIGYFGLAIIASLIASLAALVSLWDFIFETKKYGKIKSFLFIIPFLLGVGTLVSFFGVRPQVESWLFLAILTRILTKDSVWKKWRFFVPPLVLLWTNLHGSFAVSIVIIFIVTLLKSVRSKRALLDYIIIFAVSLLTTFINPYGPRLWGEVYMQLSDSTLRWRILEWMPPISFFNLSFIALLTLSFMLVIRYRRKIRLELLGLYAFFLMQGLMSSRHIPLWTIITLPILSETIFLLYSEVKNVKYGEERFIKLFKSVSIGILIIFTIQSLYSSLTGSSLSEEYFYPKKAVDYLKSNLPKNEIFSYYGWGGYLIWKFPEKKVFIDGRMPSWRWNFQSDHESSYAMEEYMNVLSGEINYKDVFQKYNVDTVLLPVEKRETFIDQLDKKFKKFLGRFNKEKLDFNFFDEIEKDGWMKVYSDGTAVIYEKI